MKRTKRLTPALPPLTPEAVGGSQSEYMTALTDMVISLTDKLKRLESRHNGQHRRIGAQEQFIATLKAETLDLRTRILFLENTEKLKGGPRL